MKPAELFPHRTSEELEHAYRQAESPVERSRWHILWLKSKRKTILELIEVTGFSRTTISTLIRRYNNEGVDAVLDRRQFNGSAPALNEAQQEVLFLAIRDTVPDSGLWTSRKVQKYIHETFDIEVTDVCAWGYLRRLGFSVQMPRPKNVKAASPEAQGAFIKK